MQTVNNFNIGRLNNAEFTGLQLNIMKAVKQLTATKLGLDATAFATHEQTMTDLVDRVYATQSSACSTEMKELDEKRDNIYCRVLTRLQLVKYGTDVRSLANAKAAVVTHLLGKYDYSVAKKAYQQASAILSGFVMDVRNKLTEDDIDALGIDNDLSALESANNAFVNAYNSRIAEMATREQGVTTRLRQEVMDYYQQLTLTVQYFANAKAIEGQTADATVCQTFIGQLNVLLTDAKRLYKRRTGKGEVEPEENEPEQQEVEGEKPNTPEAEKVVQQ